MGEPKSLGWGAKPHWGLSSVLALAVVSGACSSDESSPGATVAGASGSTGTAGAGEGGAAGSEAVSAGESGSPGGAGATAAGAGGADTGGADTGGAMGEGGSAAGGSGAGGAASAVTPSVGCGIVDPVGGTFTSADGLVEYIVSVPASYQADHPYPVGFAFHGANRTHVQCQATDCLGFQDVMEDHAILVYEKSLGNGWADEDAPYFAEILGVIKGGYCVDEERVFVAGTSSGAGHSNRLACLYGDQILATAPVAGWMPGSDCVGSPAALVIHGINDVVTDIAGGRASRDHYVAQNGCTAVGEPPVDEMDARVLAQREAMVEEGYECSVYQGCNPGTPVHWCVHSYGGYDNVNHGWPPIGGEVIWDFIQGL